MIVCEFCTHFEPGGTCRIGLKIPKKMSCAGFTPTLEGFCAKPSDFVDPKQIIQMATYFGIKGVELKKVMAMAAEATSNRLETIAQSQGS
jgi:hypothetical protein